VIPPNLQPLLEELLGRRHIVDSLKQSRKSALCESSLDEFNGKLEGELILPLPYKVVDLLG